MAVLLTITPIILEVRTRQLKIFCSPEGLRFVYDDALRGLLQLGESRVERASHVEPNGLGWVADLAPVQGPRRKFESRQAALNWERTWLEANNIPIP